MDRSDLVDRVTRAKAGDPVAIRELLLSYEQEVRMVVRGRLPRVMRSQFDSMDFVQAVWKSLFVGDGSVPDFANERHFLGYLAGMAKNKVYEAHRQRTQQKYDLNREESLYVRKGNQDVVRDFPARDPSPSQNAQARDRLDQLLEGRTDVERQIVELRQSGLGYEDIGKRLGIHEASVRRIVDSMRRRMENRGWE